MPVTWRSEACDQAPDPDSGASIFRLTCSSRHSVNIYCEQPYTSPDGNRIAIMRSVEADPRLPPFDLYVADLNTLRIQQADTDCRSMMVATSPWTGMIFYVSSSGDLVKLDISTLEKQIVWTGWPFPPDFMLQSVSPDLRFLVGILPQSNYHTALLRIDLLEKQWKTILEKPELFAGHLQYPARPAADGTLPIMGLMHRGAKLNDYWNMVKFPVEHRGPCYYSVDNEGNNFQIFPSGEPFMNANNGHSAWVGDTDWIAFSTSWNLETLELDPRWPQGNLFTSAAGGSEARVFHAPEHRFNHVSVSRCGRYFVCDSFPGRMPAPIPIVVGNLETGKYRALIRDCRASGGGPACSHPHPYFTADNRRVIYNADPHWIGHVFFATVPDSFLESLA